MKPEEKTLILLASSVVNQTSLNFDLISAIDFNSLYDLALFHQMTAIVSAALENAGIEDTRFKQDKAKAIRKNILMDNERKTVEAALDKAQIWHMPLKGAILKDYYPGIGLRQMSDNDILFDASRAEEVKAIMESLGFETVHFGTGHQDDYQKPPVSHFEMHRMLFAPTSDKRLYQYYQNIEKKLIWEDAYSRRFSNEDFYIYMIAHGYKHFYWNGTGLRFILDLYVFLQRFQTSVNWKYIEKELKKIGVSDFEKKCRVLSRKIFNKNTELDSLSKEELRMIERFTTAGVYGTKERSIMNKIDKAGTVKYIFQRIFIPIRVVKVSYPFFYKYRVLLPLLPFYRLIHRRRNAIREIKTLRKYER